MTRRTLTRIGLNGLGLLVFVGSVFPVYWMVTTAFKPSNEIFTTDFIPFPRDPTLEHADRVFTTGVAGNSIWVYLGNSLVIAMGAVVLSGLFALLGATAIARFRFRFRSSYLILLLVLQMIPGEAMVIPLYVMLVRLGMTDQLARSPAEHGLERAIRRHDEPLRIHQHDALFGGLQEEPLLRVHRDGLAR